MRVFLTGGTGFVGSHFVNQAHAAGHELVVLRRSPESRPRIPLHREPNWLDRAMDKVTAADMVGCSAVVHLAAHSANVPYDTLESCLLRNVMEPLAMMRAAIAAGVKRYFVAGSCFEYGTAGERYEFIPADAPLEPTSSYSASKAAATVAFWGLACESMLEMLFLRVFPTYGEGELASRFWPQLRRAALAGEDLPMTTGEQIRDFMPVDMVAGCFIAALARNDLVAGRPIIENLGTGSPLALVDFAMQEWARFGAVGELKPGAVPQRRNEVMRFVPVVARGKKPI